MKKTLVLVFGLICCMMSLFSACGSPYKNLELIVDNESVTIILEDDSTIIDDATSDTDETANINSATVVATINGAGKNISTQSIFSSRDTSKLLIDNVEYKDNTTIATIKAINAGDVQILVTSKEGNLQKVVNVSIIRKITSMAFDTDYNFAVLANGQDYQIDSSQINFLPTNANHRDVTYALKQAVSGVTVSENGVVNVTTKTVDSFIVVVTPTDEVHGELSCELEVNVFEAIVDGDISFLADNVAIDNSTIQLVKNRSDLNLKTISFQFNSTASSKADDLEFLYINGVASDTDILLISESVTNNKELTIQGILRGTTTLTLSIYIAGYEELLAYTKTFTINVIETVTSIVVNSSSVSEYDIYNGTENATTFTINLYPNSSNVTSYSLQCSESSHLTITNSLGSTYTSFDKFTNGQKLYISHDASLANREINITIKPNDTNSNVTLTLTFNLLIQIDSIEVDEEFIIKESTINASSIDWDTISIEDFDDDVQVLSLNYIVLPTNSDKSNLIVTSSDTKVARIIFDQASNMHYVVGVSHGTSTIKFTINGRLYKTSLVNVVTNFTGFLVSIDSPYENDAVCDRTMSTITYGSTVLGQTLTNAVIKVGKRLKIYVENYPTDSKIYSTTFELVSATDSKGNTISTSNVTLSSDGYIYSTSVISSFYVRISVKGYIYDTDVKQMVISSESLVTEIPFKVILPITNVVINAEAIELFDIDTVGYNNYDLAQKTLSLKITPSNATVSASEINWTVSDSNYESILDVQSDGSVIITGHLPNSAVKTQTVIVRATIDEYNNIISRECTVTIKRATQVESILLNNYDSTTSVYLKHSNLIGSNFISDSYQIDATAQPLEATSTNLIYVAFDITKTDENATGIEWFKNGDYEVTQNSTQINVTSSGLITTLSGNSQGGWCIVWIIPQDQLKSADVLIDTEVQYKRAILVKVADGSEELPFEIASYTDLVAINEALDKCYVICETIDLSNISNFSPIGSVTNPFTGSLSGKYYTTSGAVYNKITGFNFSITKNTVSNNMSSSNYLGLFAILGVGSNLKDLSVYVKSININAILTNSSNFYFGIACGINYGDIENVSIILNGNVSIKIGETSDSSGTSYIGGISGINMIAEGYISGGDISHSSCLTYSNFGINVSSNEILFNSETTEEVVCNIGGLVGFNENLIEGSYYYAGDIVNSDEVFLVEYVVDFNTQNLNNNILINTKELNLISSYVGGLVGVNIGNIKNVKSESKISGIYNIGGIAGQNSGTISNVLFTGTLDGYLNLGGIVGVNNSGANINFAGFEIYDDETVMSSTSSSIENVGGIVGKNSGTISYCYVYSYAVQRDECENATFDFSGISGNYLGGFVGFNLGTINKSFTNLSINADLISTKGLFVGEGLSGITNCYTIGYYTSGRPTNIIQTFIQAESSNFITVLSPSVMNFGLPMILIEEEVDYDTVLNTEAPTSMTITALDYTSGNNYYLVSDTQIIVTFDQSGSNLSSNTYDLSAILDVDILPLTARTKTVVTEIISGDNLAQVKANVLTILGEGYIKIRIYSQLDKNIYQDIEFYAIKGIKTLNVSNIVKTDGYNTLSIRKDNSYNLTLLNGNDDFDAYSDGGYLYTFDNSSYQTIEQATSIDNLHFTLDKSYNQIINGLESTSSLTDKYTLVSINPYIDATFYDSEGNLIKIQYIISDIVYEFRLVVYEGITSAVLDKQSVTIMPSTNLTMQLTIYTDVEDDFVDSIQIYKGATLVGTYYLSFTNGDAEILYDESQELKFDIVIDSTSFDSLNNLRKINFILSPIREVGEIEEIYNYSLRFNYTLGNKEVKFKTLSLTILPQQVENISANHYNDGVDFDDNLQGAGEEISTKIIAGQYGLLIINLYPYYSYLSQLTITSSQVDSDVISFEQVYYNVANDNYDTLVNGQSNITNGINAILKSQLNANSSTEFTGKVYLKTLTSSILTENAQFTITITAYGIDETGASVLVLQKQITLLVEIKPTIELTMNDGVLKSGTTNHYYIAYNTITNISLKTESICTPTNTVIDQDTAIEIAFPSYSSKTTSNNMTTYNYKFDPSTDVAIGNTYIVTFIVVKNLNGVETKVKEEITITIVDFIITGVNLYDSNGDIVVTNGLFSQPLDSSGWDLRIKLTCIVSSRNDGMKALVTAFENCLNGLSTTTSGRINPYLYYDSTSGLYSSLELGEDIYNNFEMTWDDIDGYHLLGLTLANTDVLSINFEYYYKDGYISFSENGSIQDYVQSDFRLDFDLSSSRDNPLPIYTYADFLDMEDDMDYIMMNDINLGDGNTYYTPIEASFGSLDGNGYNLILSKGFLVSSTTTDIKMGVFTTINEGTLLKNINVMIDEDAESVYDLTSYTTIQFGYLASINNGTITNTCVSTLQDDTKSGSERLSQTISTNLSSSSQTIVSNVAGFVAVNNGTITNSRVNNIEITTQGTLGGFVSENYGQISACYFKDSYLVNTYGITGGFVAVNSSYGIINTSYSQGTYASTDYANTNVVRASYLGLEVSGNSGGFVCNNSGTISDCMANIKIQSQARSAGFVYSNLTTGVIEQCLSLSDVSQNSIAHMPFVGTDSTDKYLNKGNLSNVYYYQGGSDVFVTKDISNNESGAQSLDFTKLSTASSFLSFAFSDTTDISDTAEFEGIWVLPTTTSATDGTQPYSYFNSNNFKANIPTLVSANVIAQSRRILDSEQTTVTDEDTVYYYTYDTVNGKAYGSIYNPVLISELDDLNDEFGYDDNGNRITSSTKSIRVINDIDFSELTSSLLTSAVEYSGIFDGNGLTLSNVSLICDISSTESSFGFFKSLTSNTINRGVIKNLTLNLIEVKASQTSVVGGLVGSMYDSLIFNITVEGSDVAVKGSNIVGGVVGLVEGNSRLYNIVSQISANAGYRNSSTDLQSMVYKNDATASDYSNTTEYVSYAGGVAGVIDTKVDDEYVNCMGSPTIYNLQVLGKSRVIAEIVGGVVGMLGMYVYASNLSLTINADQFIDGDRIAGGVVGELRGKLSQSYIAHTDNVQTTIDNLSYGSSSSLENISFFKNNSNTIASGGLVGFNFGGTIIDCYAKVDVRNAYSTCAGGLVGANIGGDIRAVYATGSVIAKTSVGGLIGEIITSVIESGSRYNSYYNIDYLPEYFSSDDCLLFFDTATDYNSMVLSYVVAGNNYTTSDLSANSIITNFGGMIGRYDVDIAESYIYTVHPTDITSDAEKINFFVAGGTESSKTISSIGNATILATKFTTSGYAKVINIATSVGYASITSSTKSTYFYNWSQNVWDYSTASKYPIINPKTVTGAIEIDSVQDLMQIIWKLDGDYILVADIDLSSVETWLALGTTTEPFTGTLTSKIKNAITNEYYGIYNMNIIRSNLQYHGLFGVTSYNITTYKNASISNITLSVENIDATRDYTSTTTTVGALVACANAVDITNCNVIKAEGASVLKSSLDYTGGLVGTINSVVGLDMEGYEVIYTSSVTNSSCSLPIEIVNRSSIVDESTHMYVGGLIGYIFQSAGSDDGDISFNYSNQTISLYQDDDETVLYNCDLTIGGLIGFASESGVLINYCLSGSIIDLNNVNTGVITSVGGLIGDTTQYAQVEDCMALGEINLEQTITSSASTLYVGGFIGTVISAVFYGGSTSIRNGNIYNCYSLTTITNLTSSESVSGFIGFAEYKTSTLAYDYSLCYYDQYLSTLENYNVETLSENDNYAKSTTYIIENFNFSDGHSSKTSTIYPVILVTVKSLLGVDASSDDGVFSLEEGSKLNPIIIDDVYDFDELFIENTPNTEDYVYYLQQNDITFLEIWQKSNAYIEEFYGCYNGNGFSISGLKISDGNSENVGFIGTMTGSILTGVNLTDVEIDVDYDEEATVVSYNVGGLVGRAIDSCIFACTVEGSVFANVLDSTQIMNIGGIVGLSENSDIIYAGNYASVASFDYMVYKELSITREQIKPLILNLGGVVGSFVGQTNSVGNKLFDVYSYCDLEYTSAVDASSGGAENVGAIAGYLSYAKVDKWWANSTIKISEKQLSTTEAYFGSSSAYNVTINYSEDSSSPISSSLESIESIEDLTLNYGMPVFEIFTESFNLNADVVPQSMSIIDNGNGTTSAYVYVIREDLLQFVIENNWNVIIDSDIYVDNYITVDSYSGTIDGQYNTLNNLNTYLINDFTGTIKNLAVYGESEYLTYSSSSATYDSVDLCIDTDYKMDIALNGQPTAVTDIQEASGSVITNSNLWLDLNDGNGEVIRGFVEYWHLIDLRGVRIKQEEITICENVAGDSEDGFIVEEVTYSDRYIINNVYELAKYLKLEINGDDLATKTIHLIKSEDNNNFDLGGKIWTSLGGTNSFTGTITSDTVYYYYDDNNNVAIYDNRATIKNIYVEGNAYLGFIGRSSNTATMELSNLKFENLKTYIMDTTLENTYIGGLIGFGNALQIVNIEVSGDISVSAPTANYVGGLFGYIKTKTFKYVEASINDEEDEEDDEIYQIEGLDYVGGIAGYANFTSSTVQNISNDNNVIGRDCVGGYFGYVIGSATTNFVGDGQNVGNNSKFKNTGNVTGRNYVGGIAGYGSIFALQDVINDGFVTLNGYFGGGIFGYTSTGLQNAENNGDVIYDNSLTFSEAESINTELYLPDLQTICAYFDNYTTEEDLTTIEINAGYFIGGITGINLATIIIATNNGVVEGEYFVGGIVGMNLGKIQTTSKLSKDVLDVYNSNSVSGIAFVGGIIGYQGIDAELKEALCDITVSQSSGETTRSISGSLFVGGLVGFNEGWIYNSATNCDLTTTSANYVGGITGINTFNGTIQSVTSILKKQINYSSTIDNQIENSILKISAITNEDGIAYEIDYDAYYFGGICGINYGYITTSATIDSSQLQVSETFTHYGITVYAGGVCGINNAEIDQVYVDNTCTMLVNKSTNTLGNIYFGGISAINNDTMQYCYSLAIASETNIASGGNTITMTNYGGIAYLNNGFIDSSYSYKEIALNQGTQGSKSSDCYVLTLSSDQTSLVVDETIGGNVDAYKLFLDNHYNIVVDTYYLKKISSEVVAYVVYTYHLESKDYVFADSDIITNVEYNSELEDTAFWADLLIEIAVITNLNEYFEDQLGEIYQIFDFIEIEGGVCEHYDTGHIGECDLCDINYLITLPTLNQDITCRKDLLLYDTDISIFYLYFTGNKTPVPVKVFDEEGNVTSTTYNQTPINPNIATATLNGEGTSENPYKLNNVSSFETLQRLIERGYDFAGYYFDVVQDIDFNGQTFMLGTEDVHFAGMIDGNGYTLKNLTINDNDLDNVGLFSYLGNRGKIHDLNIENFKVTGHDNVGSLVGVNEGTLQDINVYSTTTTTNVGVNGNSNVGGLAGVNIGTVRAVQVITNVSGQTNIGGIVGENSGYIMDSETSKIDLEGTELTKTIQGATNIGGIAGFSSGIITGSANNSLIKGTTYVGGIAGFVNEGKILNCANYGQIDTGNYKGGIVGEIDAGELNYCLSVGSIGTGSNVGSIAGRKLDSTVESNYCIDNLYNNGGVNGKERTQQQLINNAYKYEVYEGFDFYNNWGMTATYVNTITAVYTGFYAVPQGIPSAEGDMTLVDYEFNINIDDQTQYVIEDTGQFLDLVDFCNDVYSSKYDTASYIVYCAIISGDSLLKDNNVSGTTLSFGGSWTVIDKFQGALNGNGYTFNVNLSKTYTITTGVGDKEANSFINNNKGTVSNLNLNISQIKFADSIGGISLDNDGTISNCVVTYPSGNSAYVDFSGNTGLMLGGISSTNDVNGIIENCSVVNWSIISLNCTAVLENEICYQEV